MSAQYDLHKVNCSLSHDTFNLNAMGGGRGREDLLGMLNLK